MKQSSLFRSLPVRSGRMTIIFTASVFAHTCLVGVGAVLWQPTEQPGVIFCPAAPPLPPIKETKIELTEETPGRILLVPNGAPAQSTPEAVPPSPASLPDSATVLPVSDVPEMSPPPQRPAVRTARPTTVVATAQNSNPVGTRIGTVVAGTPGTAGIGSVLGWKTPRPPYPRSLLLSRVQGTTTVHFTTDASGSVASASIVKSTGNAALDASTLSFVRANWRGPANAARTTEFVYQLP